MDKNNFKIIKQSLGNVIYSQKTQEMAAIRKQGYVTKIKWANIILVGLVFLFLFLDLLSPNSNFYNYISIALTVSETLFLIFQLSFNPEKETIEHKNTANKLWLMREKHLNLLTDIKNEIFDFAENSQIRDELTKELSNIYKEAPQTNNDDYRNASTALNGNQKPKVDDDEYINFLPENLR
ncbi:MAG: SLATT domain-containing protein [Campylobacterales bacterium]|jgi:hypothetical protein|nr:SLATT domain-containing protein [Campylobacterales bacterium]